MKKNITFVDCQFQLLLLWRHEGTRLPDNKLVAFSRLKSLGRRLQNDKNLLERQGVKTSIDVVPAGVDFERVDNGNNVASEKSIFIIGSLDWKPNEEVSCEASIKAGPWPWGGPPKPPRTSWNPLRPPRTPDLPWKGSHLP